MMIRQSLLRWFPVLAGSLVLMGCASTASPPPAVDEARVIDRSATGGVAERRGDVIYQLLLGEFAGQRDQLSTAVDAYLAAARSSDDPRVAERATRIALYAGDTEATLAAADRWQALEPGNTEVIQVLASLHLKQGRGEQAAAALAQLIRASAPDTDDGIRRAAGLLVHEAGGELAVELMQDIVEAHPDSAVAHFALSRIAQREGRSALAVRAVERALALDPKLEEARLYYVGLLNDIGEVERAIDQLRQAVANSPDNRKLRLTLARLLVERGELEAAKGHFEKLQEMDAENAEIRFALALLAFDLDQFDEAAERFRALLDDEEQRDQAAYYLGRLAEERGDLQRARSFYEDVNREPMRLEAQIRIAGLMRDAGRDQAAHDYLERLRKAYAGEDDALKQVFLVEAEWLREDGEFAAALGLYDQALEAFPGDQDILYARALTADKLGRMDRLEADLRAILENDPDNVNALNALGYTLANRTDRLDEARELIERAFEQRPEDPAILDSMGWVHFRLGEPRKAREYLEAAHARVNDPEIAAHLGEVLWALGERDRAREIWSEAREQFPGAEILEDTIRRLTR